MERLLPSSPCPLYVLLLVFVVSYAPRTVAADFSCVPSRCSSGAPTLENALRLRISDVERALQQCFPSFRFTAGVSDVQISAALEHLGACDRRGAGELWRAIEAYRADLINRWRSCCNTQSLGKRRRRSQMNTSDDHSQSQAWPFRDVRPADVTHQRTRSHVLQRILDYVASHALDH